MMKYKLIGLTILLNLNSFVFAKNDNRNHTFFFAVKDGIRQIISEDNKVIFSGEFDGLYSFTNNFSEVLINNKFGFLSSSGKIIKPQFKEVNSFSNGLAGVRIDDKWGFINENGETVIKFQFDEVQKFSDGLASVKINGKWGVINQKGNVIIKPEHTFISEFNNGIAELNHDSIVNRQGKILNKKRYQSVNIYNTEMVIIENNYKYGFMDRNGRVIKNPIFDSLSNFVNGLASFVLNKKLGIIDKKGKILVYPIKADLIEEFYNGLAKVKLNGKWGFINSSGNIIIKPQYDNIFNFKDGLAKVHKIENNVLKVGFINKKGDLVKPFRLASNCEIEEQTISKKYIHKKLNNNYIFYDENGNSHTTNKFNYVECFNENFAKVSLIGKWGFIDKKGSIVIKPKYDWVKLFKYGLNIVSDEESIKIINNKGEIVADKNINTQSHYSKKVFSYYIKNVKSKSTTYKYGLSDYSGKIITKPVFDEIYDFSEGVFVVAKDNKFSFIDETGKYIIKDKFENAKSFNDGLASVKIDDKWGFINKNGDLLIKNRFKYVTDFSEGLAGVCLDDKWGYINNKGVFVIKPQYYYADKFINNRALVTLFENAKDSPGNTSIFIDKDANIINKKIYSNIYNFDKDATIGIDYNKAYILNKKINIIKELDYDIESVFLHLTNGFKEGFWGLSVNGRFGFIDTNGNLVIPNIYGDVTDFSEGLAGVKTPDKWGFIDKNWNIVIEPKYDNLSNFENDYSIFRIKNKYGVINTKGQVVIEPVYEHLSFIRN
ncbi:MAG: WG repeat-containing protein [Candidatus Sericytochromatia bacterium]